jgi:hypothetical protein
MPSDQSTWLIAVPNDGDAEGLHSEITSKLAQQSRSSQPSVSELGILAFKVRCVFRRPHSAGIADTCWAVDRHTRFPHHTFRRAPKAGRVLHFYRRKGCGHSAKPP